MEAAETAAGAAPDRVLIVVVLLMALVSVVSNKLRGRAQRGAVPDDHHDHDHRARERVVGGARARLRDPHGAGLAGDREPRLLVMKEAHLQHLIFVFPELLLLLFALTAIAGCFSGAIA